jgi:putative ABC transport system permease protein
MKPPRLARWLMSLAVPPGERADVLGDLDEGFAAPSQTEPRRWYWRQVRRSFGPLIGQRLRAISQLPRGLGRDLSFSLRSLRAAPAFAIGVILMLAIGIGAHLVVYAVVDGLLLRPLPFGDRSDRLVTLHSTHPTIQPDWDDAELSYPDFMDMRRRSRSLERIEGVIGRNVSLASRENSDRVLGASVTPGFFDMLGVPPALGRNFTANDAAPIGQEASVIVSSALWRSMLAADPRIVGMPVLMNGRALTVIGVMPEGFSFPEGQQLWLPYRDNETDRRANRGLMAIGLVREGASLADTRAELSGIAATLAAEYPVTNRGWSVHVMPIRDFFVSGGREATLLGAVTLVLLVVCANVAGLIVARGVGRQRELSLRAALGAGRARLVRLLVMETALLATVGGALGFLAASWGVRALMAWIPEPPPYWARPELDVRVALAAIGITALVALAAGLLPAIRISRVDASGALLPGARANTGAPRHRRMQHWLVAGQVALSLALLFGAGLLTQSATALLQADGGFDPSPLLSMRFYIAGDRYDDPSVRGAVVNTVVERIAAIPGVTLAGATGSIPTDDGGATGRLRNPAAPGDATREIGVQYTPATASFWPSIGLELKEGRGFTAAEAANSASDVAVINTTLAARLWPGESAIGRVLHLSEPMVRPTHPSGSFAPLRIVGVSPDLVYEEFGESTPQSQLMVYLPTARVGWRTQALLVRTSGDTSAISAAIRAEIRRIDPGFAVFDVMTMTDRRAYNHWAEKFIGRAASVFAMVALVLACIGAYAIAAYTVAQRTREIGLRLALGSTRSGVMRVFLTLGGRLALAGAIVGLGLAFLVARLLQNELFNVSPWTLSDWVTPALVLIAAVVVATYLPARRASRIDPSVALRSE